MNWYVNPFWGDLKFYNYRLHFILEAWLYYMQNTPQESLNAQYKIVENENLHRIWVVGQNNRILSELLYWIDYNGVHLQAIETARFFGDWVPSTTCHEVSYA